MLRRRAPVGGARTGRLGALAAASALGAVAHDWLLPAPTRELLWQPLYLALGVTMALFVAAPCGGRGDAARRTLGPMLALAVLFYGITRYGGDFLRSSSTRPPRPCSHWGAPTSTRLRRAAPGSVRGRRARRESRCRRCRRRIWAMSHLLWDSTPSIVLQLLGVGLLVVGLRRILLPHRPACSEFAPPCRRHRGHTMLLARSGARAGDVSSRRAADLAAGLGAAQLRPSRSIWLATSSTTSARGSVAPATSATGMPSSRGAA